MVRVSVMVWGTYRRGIMSGITDTSPVVFSCCCDAVSGGSYGKTHRCLCTSSDSIWKTAKSIDIYVYVGGTKSKSNAMDLPIVVFYV